jgi:Phosphotransferase enzyme family
VPRAWERGDGAPWQRGRALALSGWSALVRELVEDGVLDAAIAVDGGLVVDDVSRRNHNALASQRSSQAFFIKREAEPGRESQIYRRLCGIPGLSEYLPEVALSDPARALLLLFVEREAQDLWAHHLARGRFPPALGHALGRALGLLHLGTRLPAPRPAPNEAPFVLGLHRPRVEDLRELSPASIELVKLIQRNEAIGAGLEELRRGWQEVALMHSDVKWPNVIVVPSAGDAPTSIRLVDWEHARDGDPAWDVGSALGAYVTFWLSSIPLSGPRMTPEEIASRARFPIHQMRPAIRACWAGYRAAAEVPLDASHGLLRRAVGLCAARLIRTAFEGTETRATMSTRARLHLQVAANVMSDPGAAARRLLGLTLDTAPA